MLLLKLRWAAVLLKEFWRCRRAESASCLPAIPGRAGGLGRMRGPGKLCLVSLDMSGFGCSDANLDDGPDALLWVLKCSSSPLPSTRLGPLWACIPGRWGGQLLGPGCRSVALVQAEASSETAIGFSSNWTLYFSLFLPSHAELLPSVSCCLRETSWDDWASTGPRLCLRRRRTLSFRSAASSGSTKTSCTVFWYTGKGPVPRFTAADGFRRSAEAELLVLCPRLPLIPLLGAEGIKAGKDLSLCGEEKAEGLALLAVNIAWLVVERWQGFFFFLPAAHRVTSSPGGRSFFHWSRLSLEDWQVPILWKIKFN